MSILLSGHQSKQKRLGAYYTPPHLAEFLVRWAVRQPQDRVLEPACGEAVFLHHVIARLAELGHSPLANEQVVGYELDSSAATLAREAAPAACIIQGDFFQQAPPPERFDAVVGNPPYVRYHYFSGEARQRALARALTAGVPLSGLTSSWAPFLVHASMFLAPGGRLALILPAELLTTDYAGPIREFLLRRFAAVEVITFERRVFPAAMVDAVLLLAEGTGPGRLRIHRLSDANDLATFTPSGAQASAAGKWTSSLLAAEAATAMDGAARQMVPLGNLAAVDIGIVTGANRFFVLSDVEASAWTLEPPTLGRLVARTQQMRSYQYTEADWEAQRRQGAAVWLFAPAAKYGPAARYIEAGESDGAHTAYKCRIRRPWWRLKLPEPPDLLLSYMSNHAPRLVANTVGALTTNLIHNVRLCRLLHPDVQAVDLALSWVNSATLLSCEMVGRAYGGGVLKLETREAERVLVPELDLSVAAELRRLAPKVDFALRSGEFEAAADVIDPVVLGHLSSHERHALRNGWRDLRVRRKQRSSPARSA